MIRHLTVKLLVPVAVGVPEMIAGARCERQAGRQRAGRNRPGIGRRSATRRKRGLYAVFTVPFGSEVVVTEAPAFTTMLSAWVAVCELLSVTCTVKLLVPVAVGVRR